MTENGHMALHAREIISLIAMGLHYYGFFLKKPYSRATEELFARRVLHIRDLDAIFCDR